MRKKLVLLIALVLALAQGVAAQEALGIGGIDMTAEYFEAYVGQTDTHTITLQYVTQGVVRLTNDGQQEPSSLKGTNDYSVSIISRVFTATLIDVTVVSGNTTTTYTATVEVTYAPTAAGEHTATVYLNNAAGQSVASQDLVGVATVLRGDVNGDGLVNVADVTAIIDYLLSGDAEGINLDAADVDGDGNVSVADVSDLIDLLLGVPDIRRCTFIIILKTNGVNDEYMINENTKINITDGHLRIQGILMMNGTPYHRPISIPLKDLAHLSYDERMVTFDSTLTALIVSAVRAQIILRYSSDIIIYTAGNSWLS